MLSIIMPSYNQAEFIGESIESVFGQVSPYQVELVISDGGSTDATLEVLKAKAEKYDNLRWVSEADSGPANALNKSLSKTRGTIIGWLNSDDLYTNTTFAKVYEYFDKNPDTVLVYGQGEHVDIKGNHIELYPTAKPNIGFDAFQNGSFICQPTVFFKRTVYTLLGPLDERYKAAFDFEYWMRAFKHFQPRIGFIDDILAKSRLHEDCITQKMRGLVASDGAHAVAQYFGEAPIHWLSTYVEEMRRDLGDDTFSQQFGEIMDFVKTMRDCFEPRDFNALLSNLKATT